MGSVRVGAFWYPETKGDMRERGRAMDEGGEDRTTPDPVPASILVVYAHPDDESFGPAALLARYARAGSAVYGVFATHGEHGRSGVQPAPGEMARLREQDLRAATGVIGFRAIAFLDYEDGTLTQAPAARLEAQVLDAIKHWTPQIILTFGPAGITRHPDHLAIHRAVVAAFYRARDAGLDLRELYYDAVLPDLAREMGIADDPDGQPNIFVDVQATTQVKLEALRLHARHIEDAHEMADRLEREPQLLATLHRAFPPVPPGMQLTHLLA